MTQVLYVAAHNHTFCIDVCFVEKIIQLPELEMLPGAPDEVAGLLNYKGKVIAVYDMAMLMGIDRNEAYSLNTMVVICAHDGKAIGLIVDSIKGQDVVKLGEAENNARIEGHGAYLESAVTLNNVIVMVPAIKKIINRQVHLDEMSR